MYAFIEKIRRLRWRYSLRTVFVAMTAMAVIAAWHAHRLQIINHERMQLRGVWQWEDNTNIYETVFSEVQTDIGVPSNGVGQIDFHNPVGVSKGIYRVVGDKIEVAQNQIGKPRPTNFDEGAADSVWTARKIDRQTPSDPKEVAAMSQLMKWRPK